MKRRIRLIFLCLPRHWSRGHVKVCCSHLWLALRYGEVPF